MPVASSGTIRLGDLTVNRLGFGAMRLTGEGVWGPPADEAEARRVLLRARELGTTFIDTADAYGPETNETLIAQTLHPYGNLVIATKGGLTRSGPGVWAPVGRPEYLRQCVMLSLRRLKVDRLDLWQLHRIDAKVPRDEQFQAIAELQKAGFIRHVGLSEVKVDDLEAARKFFPVVSVQNLYNLVNRGSEAVLTYCEQHGVAFIPWFPLASGALARPGSVLSTIAQRLSASPSQVALAWVLARSKVTLPIPGTSRVAHLEENAKGASLQLSAADFRALDEQGRAEWARQPKP
jgi:aryl-alcohol dehydrogenase-like predicted oxidoreductase